MERNFRPIKHTKKIREGKNFERKKKLKHPHKIQKNNTILLRKNVTNKYQLQSRLFSWRISVQATSHIHTFTISLTHYKLCKNQAANRLVHLDSSTQYISTTY